MGNLQEIDALQRWVFQDAGLTSIKLKAAPPTVARPAILWETPQRGKAKNLNRYTYVVRVQQYGKLFVADFDQAADLQDKLLGGIEERYGVLPVYESDQADADKIAKLKAVTIDFGNSETLDIPITVTYEATYGRTKPEALPTATKVTTKTTTQYG